MIKLYEGDCLEVMKGIEKGSVDAIIADLPYGTTACRWDTVIPLEPLWEQYKRIIKKKGAIVLFSSQPFTSVLVISNLKWFRCEWIWHKSVGGGFLNANRYPLKRHENILVFASGLPCYNPQMTEGEPYQCTRGSAGEITFDQSVAGWLTKNNGTRYPITIQHFANETGYHPTQKPVPLLRYLIRTYTNLGEKILDNTMGSGSTGVACVLEDRDFIGVDLQAEYVEIAKKRIQAAQDEIKGRLFV